MKTVLRTGSCYDTSPPVGCCRGTTVPDEVDCMPATAVLLTTTEVAELLRTSRKAIYAMVERGQLPGIVRIGRRVLVREDALPDWLCQKSTPLLER